MDRLIDISKRKSFSEKDLAELTEGKCDIRTYSTLSRCSSIGEAWGRNRAMIVLFETRPNYGHWVCVFEADPETIEVFDPYGLGLDRQLAFIEKNFRKRSRQDRRYLTGLIENSGYKRVIVNDYRLQSYRSDTSTCGRWCGLRICMRDFSLPTFISLFEKQKFKPDWYASALTMFV